MRVALSSSGIERRTQAVVTGIGETSDGHDKTDDEIWSNRWLGGMAQAQHRHEDSSRGYASAPAQERM